MMIQTLYKHANITVTDTAEKKLDVLMQWYEKHISKDLLIEGKIDESLSILENLIELYDKFYVKNKKKELLTPFTELGDQSKLEFAAFAGFHFYLEQAPLSQNLLEHKNQYGMTPLHIAASEGNIHTVALLIEMGARLRLENEQGDTPAFCALRLPAFFSMALKINKEAIFLKMLTEGSFQLQHKNQQGENITHLMAAYGYVTPMKIILKEHPELVRDINHHDHTAAHIAILNHQPEILDLIFTSGITDIKDSDEKTLLHFTAQYGTSNMLSLCLKARMEINACDNMGETPMMLAASYGNVETVDYLLSHHAEISAVDAYEQTALHLAVKNNHKAIAEKLLNAEPTLIIKTDQNNQTPLDVARQCEASFELIRLLEKYASNF